MLKNKLFFRDGWGLQPQTHVDTLTPIMLLIVP